MIAGKPQAGSIAQRLRELPADEAPPYGWSEFRRRMRGESARGGRESWPLLALAAALAVMVVGLAVWQRTTRPAGETPAVLAEFPLADAGAGARRAERWFASLPSEPAIVRVDTWAAVTALEDRIAWVDDALSEASFAGAPPARVAELRRERSQLVDSLVQVRYAESLAAATAR